MQREYTPKPDLVARQVAAQILWKLVSEWVPLDVCISRDFNYQNMLPQDKAFCLRLMQTYLRHKGQIDAEIENLMERPLASKFQLVSIHIGLAMVQIAHMDIPPYAAVNSAVELVKSASEHHKGLANAVLNRWVKEGATFQAGLLSNIPLWLREKWQDIYGVEHVQHMAEILAQEPALDMTFKDASDMEEVKSAYPDQPCHSWDNTLRISQPGQVSEMPGYAEGKWWVQDLAASLPVQLMGDIRGARVLDMCAAPGGKTMQLYARGAKVTAIDSSKKRLSIVAENLERTGFCDVELIEKDALKFQTEEKFYAVLLDAPCSATGTFRRNPDVLWIRTRRNLLEITDKQQKLLEKSLEMIPLGGIVIYAVCSLEPEEGETQIERLLNMRTDMIVDLELPPLPMTLVKSEFGLRALPGAHRDIGGLDGFFMTRLRKLA